MHCIIDELQRHARLWMLIVFSSFVLSPNNKQKKLSTIDQTLKKRYLFVDDIFQSKINVLVYDNAM